MENNEIQTVDYELSARSVKGMQAMMALSKSLAQSDIIPETFKGKPANVFIALDMAERMGAGPFAIMQNMYIVYGNPSFSSKFLIACFNACGRFTSIKYEFFGTPNTDGWGCKAYAVEKATGEKVASIDVTIQMAKAEGWYDKKGSKWKTMPQLMLQYRAAAFLIKTCAPEISMGLMTTEEVDDTIEMQMTDGGTFKAQKEALQEEVKQVAEKAEVVDLPVSQAAAQPAPVEAVKEAVSRPSWMQK